jgi:hypothetical protein
MQPTVDQFLNFYSPEGKEGKSFLIPGQVYGLTQIPYFTAVGYPKEKTNGISNMVPKSSHRFSQIMRRFTQIKYQV